MKTEMITRKDGIVYERKKKELKWDGNLHLRYSKNDIDKLKAIAKKEGKRYQIMVKEILDDFIKYYEESEEYE